MIRARRFARNLAACESGHAFVEFAFVLPVMLAMYMLAFVLSDMIACQRKVTETARSVTDLATRYSALSTVSANANYIGTMLSASQQVMQPYNGAVVRLSEVCALSNDALTVQVIWSQTSTGSGARTVGSTSTVPSGLFSTSQCQIMGEVSYAYTPMRLIGGQTGSMYLSDTIYMIPRLTTNIPLNTY
jgi:Flp pilus assembly protein TadG